MTTAIEIQITNQADNNMVYATWAKGSGGSFYSLYEVDAGVAGDGYRSTILRFPGVNIPSGQVITAAYLKLYGENAPAGAIKLTVWADKEAAPIAPIDVASFWAKPKSVASVAYNIASGGWSSAGYNQSSDLTTLVQELYSAYGAYSNGAMQFILWDNGSDASMYAGIVSYYDSNAHAAVLHIEYGPSGPSAPTVTTQATSSVSYTSAIGNGNITSTGGENPNKRGICYSTVNNPPTIADSKVEESGSFGAGAFTENLSGLSPNTTYYARAYAVNSQGTSYGSVDTFTTPHYTITSLAAYHVYGSYYFDTFSAASNVTNPTLAAYALQWGTDTSYGNEYSLGADYYGGSALVAIASYALPRSTLIHYRAVARVSGDPDFYSIDYTVTTSGPPPTSMMIHAGGAGDFSSSGYATPSGTPPWQCVQHYNDGKYLSIPGSGDCQDLYTPDSIPYVSFTSLKIAAIIGANYSYQYGFYLKVNGTLWTSSLSSVSNGTFYEQIELTTNPITGLAWKNSDLTGLQFGLRLYTPGQLGAESYDYEEIELTDATPISNIVCISSYWDVDASGTMNSVVGTPENTADMLLQATYVGWDFATPIWYISPFFNDGYPAFTTAFTITASSNSGGTISPAGTIIVSSGSNQPFVMAANPHNNLSNLFIDGVSVGSPYNYTFVNVLANHTIYANFDLFTSVSGPFSRTWQ
jgi:hypothetical protein